MVTANILCLTSIAAAGAMAEDRRIPWTELQALGTEGHKVEVSLKDGARVRGRVTSVSRDAVGMTIEKVVVPGASERYSRGQTTIPGSDVKSMKVDRTGTRARIIGTSIGAALGVGMGIAAQDDAQAVAGYGLAPVVIGYGLGWLIDRRTLRIEFVELPATAAAVR